jgi:hypothetical protein
MSPETTYLSERLQCRRNPGRHALLKPISRVTTRRSYKTRAKMHVCGMRILGTIFQDVTYCLIRMNDLKTVVTSEVGQDQWIMRHSAPSVNITGDTISKTSYRRAQGRSVTISESTRPR